MKILSINFGFNGSMCFLDNGKVIKHTSFSKLNYGKDRDIIKSHTFSNFLDSTDLTFADIDYVVFVGFDRSKIDYGDELDFMPNDWFDINESSRYDNHKLEKKPLRVGKTLLPPETNRPYDFIAGHFLFRNYVIQSLIVSPDYAYASYGYFTSRFNRSLNITVSSNDDDVYSGSLVTMSKGESINVLQRPKISVGKLYPKITELLGFGLGKINTTTLHDLSTRYHIPENLEDIIDEGVDNKLSDIRDMYELSFFQEHSNNEYYQRVERHKSIHYNSFGPEDVNNKFVLKTSALTQKVLENTVIKLIEDTLEKYSSNFTDNITLSGDVFENRRLNTKILERFKDNDIHIPPYNTSETMSMGAAMFVNVLFGGQRRVYSKEFLLSTTPYKGDFVNLGDDIDYEYVSNELKKNLISFNNKNPECTQKGMGYTGLLFDVECDRYNEIKNELHVNPFEKPVLIVLEESFNKHFNPISYTYDNNTIAKPLLPHVFSKFIHDDGHLNVFVINEENNKYLYTLLKKTNNDYLGYCDFRSKNTKHIILLKTIFQITQDLGINLMLIDDKQHIKDYEG